MNPSRVHWNITRIEGRIIPERVVVVRGIVNRQQEKLHIGTELVTDHDLDAVNIVDEIFSLNC